MFIDLGEYNLITDQVISAAIEVHRNLGPGLLESVYSECMEHELRARKMAFARQVEVPIFYKGQRLGAPYRLDLLVEHQVVVELKAVEQLEAVHRRQLLTYLRLTEKKVGLLMNFNVQVMTNGIRRILNTI